MYRIKDSLVMGKIALFATLLAIGVQGCTGASSLTPSMTEQPTRTAATAAATPILTEVATPRSQPTRVPVSTSTAADTPAPLSTTVVPSATPSYTASPLPPPTATPPAATEARPSNTPASQPTLPQAVATAIPEASWPYVSGLVVMPDNPSRLYAVIEGAFYSSVDRAKSWQAVDMAGVAPQASVTAVAIDYRNPATIYLLTSQGIYRREGGQAWAFVHTLKAMSLAVDMIDASILWAGVAYSTEYDAIILKSDDRGRTWGKADAGMRSGSGSGVGTIVIDPADPNVFFANTRHAGRFGWPLGGLFRGRRDGHWEQLDVGPQWPQDCLPNGLAFDPDLRRLYVGCDVYYYNERRFLLRQSDNAYAANSAEIVWGDGSLRWPTQPDLAYGAVRPLAVDARLPKTLYLEVTEYTPRAPRHIMLISENDSSTWEALPLP